MSSVTPFVSPYKSQVIRLYRQILKLGRSWTSSSNKPADTKAEREFIILEAQTLFRKNQNLTDPKVISDRLHEARARIDLGKNLFLHSNTTSAVYSLSVHCDLNPFVFNFVFLIPNSCPLQNTLSKACKPSSTSAGKTQRKRAGNRTRTH